MTMLEVLGALAAYFAGVLLVGIVARNREKRALGEQLDMRFPKDGGRDSGKREVAMVGATHR